MGFFKHRLQACSVMSVLKLNWNGCIVINRAQNMFHNEFLDVQRCFIELLMVSCTVALKSKGTNVSVSFVQTSLFYIKKHWNSGFLFSFCLYKHSGDLRLATRKPSTQSFTIPDSPVHRNDGMFKIMNSPSVHHAPKLIINLIEQQVFFS